MKHAPGMEHPPLTNFVLEVRDSSVVKMSMNAPNFQECAQTVDAKIRWEAIPADAIKDTL